MKKYILILIILLASKLFSQTDLDKFSVININEDSLMIYFNELYLSRNDDEKMQINDKIFKLFNQTLQAPETFNYPFDSLTKIGKILSPDNNLRIFTWNIPLSNGENKYFGFLQMAFDKANIYNVFPLKVKSQNIDNFQNRTLKLSDWYGALYYEIIPVKYKRDKYYVVLSLDFNDVFTNKKIIDVIYFSDDYKEMFFGKPVFQTKNGIKSRLVFEYSSRVVMSLKYDKVNKQIVFDHLSPTKPSLKDVFQFYGPDFSYDALKLEKNVWKYIEDVNMTNK